MKRARAIRGFASLAWTAAGFLAADRGPAQLPTADPMAPGVDKPPASWRTDDAPACGAQFVVPADFARTRTTQFHRHKSYQGRLGGAIVKLHVNAMPGKFWTVSRMLLDMSATSTLLEVFAYRLDGEPAAIVKRRDRKTRRFVLENVVCPRRRGISLELQFVSDPGPQAFAEGQRLLGFLSVKPVSRVTVAVGGPEVVRREEIGIGFDQKFQDDVEIETSKHYRLYTTAPSGRKLLALMENELLPRIHQRIAKVPDKLEGGPLPIFLHNTKQEFLLAGRKQGIPLEQIEAMQGYAWDRFYSTSYMSPRASVHVHEGTHQWITAVLGLDGGGPWLQEGLAQWIESEFAHRDPTRRAHNLLRSKDNAFPRLRALIGARTLLGDSDLKKGFTTPELYDIAASLVRYLAQEHHNAFRDLLLQAGVLPQGHTNLVEAAFRRSIRMDLPALENAWLRWLRKGS